MTDALSRDEELETQTEILRDRDETFETPKNESRDRDEVSNVHLHCIVSKLKRINKMSTLPSPWKNFCGRP